MSFPIVARPESAYLSTPLRGYVMASIAPKEPKQEEAGAALLEKFDMAEDDSTPIPAHSQPKVETESVPVEVAEEKPKAKHAAWLSRAAKNAGLEDSEVNELSSDDLKEAIFIAGQRRAEDNAQQRVNAAGRPYDHATGRLLPSETAPEAPAAKVTDTPFSLKDVGIDEKELADFDPALTKNLTGMAKSLYEQNKQLSERIKQLEDGVGEIGKREHLRTLNATYDKLDQMFTENETTFGKGVRTKLKNDSPEFARRLAVIKEMDRLRSMNPNLSVEETFEKASSALFPSQPKEEPVKDPHGFSNGKILTPTSRRTVAPPKGKAAAEANVEAILKQRAASQTSSEDEDLPE